MWRAFFLAVGIFVVVLGLEFLVLEKVVIASASRPPGAQGMSMPSAPQRTRDFKPPESLPWILLSAGAVVIIYSFTLPKRVGSPAPG